MQITGEEVFQVIFSVMGAAVSILLWGVLFFLKRLVKKIDLIDGTLNDLRLEVATFKAKLHVGKSRRGGNGEVLHEI